MQITNPDALARIAAAKAESALHGERVAIRNAARKAGRPTVAREGYADLPLHVRDSSGVCAFCLLTDIWATYEEYVEHFYAEEWEGERHHVPSDEEEFTYLRDSCLA